MRLGLVVLCLLFGWFLMIGLCVIGGVVLLIVACGLLVIVCLLIVLICRILV